MGRTRRVAFLAFLAVARVASADSLAMVDRRPVAELDRMVRGVRMAETVGLGPSLGSAAPAFEAVALPTLPMEAITVDAAVVGATADPAATADFFELPSADRRANWVALWQVHEDWLRETMTGPTLTPVTGHPDLYALPAPHRSSPRADPATSDDYSVAPEPASIYVAGLGAIAFGVLHRRLRRRPSGPVRRVAAPAW